MDCSVGSFGRGIASGRFKGVNRIVFVASVILPKLTVNAGVQDVAPACVTFIAMSRGKGPQSTAGWVPSTKPRSAVRRRRGTRTPAAPLRGRLRYFERDAMSSTAEVRGASTESRMAGLRDPRVLEFDPAAAIPRVKKRKS